MVFANEDDLHWQIDIAPYLWAINMKGTVEEGPFTTHIHQNFDELMQHFNGGGMLWLDAYKGAFGIFLNGLYTNLSDDADKDINFDLKTHFGLISGGLSYIFLQKNTAYGLIRLEPYLGARYTFNNVALQLESLPKAKSNQAWTDPIIGIRFRDDFNERWLITLSADAGGKNYHTQYSSNFIGLLGYKPQNISFNNTTLYLGYRYLSQHYEHGEGLSFFAWKMHLLGPIAGINFNLQ